jgi:hypothetical protein
MLSPKRTKYRKQQRGRMKGKATRGNRISFGEYGLVALEPAWITARQIEASRRVMSRYVRREARSGSASFPTSPLPGSLPKPAWDPAKATPSTGFASSSQAASSLKWGEFLKQQPGRRCAWPLTSFPSKLSL